MQSDSHEVPVLTDYQLDPVAEGFFVRAEETLARAESRESRESEDLARTPQLSRGDRRAMRATFALLGMFGIGLLAFVIYARVIMPVPAELGDGSAAPLPAASQD